MISETTKNQILTIIKSVIHAKSPEYFWDNVNWEELLEFARTHDIVALLADAVAIKAPDEIKKEFLKYSAFAASRHFVFEQEIENIRTKFVAEEISFMLLKGNVMKMLYPNPELRSMGDIDILIKTEDIEKVEKIMLSSGYAIKVKRPDEISYFKAPFILIEMHTQFVSDSHTNINNYYGDGWRFANLKENSLYEYEMRKEDFFVFQIAHFAKHYATSGSGIRPVIDIWILRQKWGQDMDYGYIDSQLDILKLKKFAHALYDLVDMWFEDGKSTPLLLNMEDYIFSSGVHGSVGQRSVCKEVKAKSKTGYKFSKYYNAIFLNKETMKKIYPELEKKPMLLPYYTVKRWIDKIFGGSAKKFVDREKQIKANFNVSEIKNHFDELGL